MVGASGQGKRTDIYSSSPAEPSSSSDSTFFAFFLGGAFLAGACNGKA